VRILFVNEKLGFFGGVEQNAGDAAAGLRGRGHACFLAWGERTDRAPEEYARLFDGAWPCAELGARVAGAQDMAQIAAQARPDVIYYHKAARLPLEGTGGARTVRMVHDHDLCCPRRHKYFLRTGRVCNHRADWRCWFDGAFLARDRGRRLGARFVCLAAHRREMKRNQRLDALIVGSRFMRDELAQNGFDAGRIHLLAPMVRMADTRPAPLPEEPEILYVGQLIRGKGVDLLLRAVALLKVEWRLSIVGAGNGEGKLRDLCARLGLEGRVRFAGWTPHEALGDFYDSARVVAAPSRWPEPFGMVGVEAMARGRPVAGFAVGGIPDWLEDEVTGLLAPEQDVAGLAAALERLLADGALARRLGEAARQRYEERYGFDRYLCKLESILSGQTPPAGKGADCA